MKAAVIDLGTNTFHLIIAELSASGVEVIYKTNVPVRLGEGRINENLIIPSAFERGIDTLREFRKTIETYDVIKIRAIATSAVRSAANGADFVAAADNRAGISIEVISGEEEAGYIFNGVKATGVIRDSSLIIDIGGGSTEFIICNSNEQLWKKSYDIGAARLMQAYFHSDPISTYDQTDINQRLDNELVDLKAACAIYQPKLLVGSAGAFETFAAMLLDDVDIKAISFAELDINHYKQLSADLILSTHAQREVMPDLISLRVDMIVIAALITNYVLETCELQAMALSTYDLKMGVLQLIKEDQNFESAT